MDIRKIIITEALERELENFITDWSSRISTYKNLELDFSWPSLGVIDLLTFSFRHKAILQPNESRYFSTLCLYIAKTIVKFSEDSEHAPEIFRDENEYIRVKLTIANFHLEVPLEEMLLEIFRDFKPHLLLTTDFKRPVSYDSVILSSTILSIISGTAPYLNLKKFDSKSLEKSIEKKLSVDLASWFEKNFPKLELLHVPELYLKGFVFPYLFMEETPLLEKSVLEIFDYFESLKLPRDYIYLIIEAFSLCPDEQVSAISIALAGYYESESKLPISVIAIARARRYLTPFLRSAMIKSRNGYKDWLEFDPLGNDVFFKIEKELGTNPWLTLSWDWISKNMEIAKEFLIILKSFELNESKKLLEELIANNPKDIEARIQLIKLEFVSGDLDKSHEMCKSLISEPRADTYPDFFNLWGSTLLALNEPEIAARYFRAANSIKHTLPSLKAEILNNLGWSNLLLGNKSSAKENFSEAEILSLCPITIWLNLAFLLSTDDQQVESTNYLKKAFKFSPFDRRVFSNF